MDLRLLQQQVVSSLMGSPLIQALMTGKATREHYKHYLTDVHAYACHSSAVIGHAASRMVLSHPQLAEYLFHHASEELGHEKWVASDLRDLGLTDDEIANAEPSSACQRMMALEYWYALHQNPVGLFGWMFVLESLGGKVGGSLAKALDQSLGLQGKATYFVKGHGEADSHHSEDLYRVITEHVVTPNDQRDFLRMAQESNDLYYAILEGALRAGTVDPAALKVAS